ncbi:glycosyl-4,4'-diaponeurosporenoate acyltransferase CrtO family protein [Granulicella arctica]|uniref:glycosyl-4,4'-diaponeurosporenoate acyltransferase CrtO family protein n=1 Tax=Granulicella arctica TaxID=940613 RepID=UPI0021E09B91|nr:hypothetical protein [Granulicella arctica]
MLRSYRIAVFDRPSSSLRNALLNVFWSLLGIAPVFVFCNQFMARPLIYGFVAASFLAYAIPAKLLAYVQLSSRSGPYRFLRVHLLVRVTQDRRSLASLRHRPIDTAWFRHRETLEKMIRVTIGRERFHLAMVIFFLLATGYAVLRGLLGWSLLLCISNLIYNLYPMWLQQYIRIRVYHCLVRSGGSRAASASLLKII